MNLIPWETGPDHLAKVHAAQHALIHHLRRPSELAEVTALAKDGPVKSKSAIFMLRTIDQALPAT